MNCDPKVMEFVGPILNEDQSKAMMVRAQNSWSDNRFGRFAVEVLESSSFIGFIGLALTRIETHFSPAVEIGWRLATKHWGKGYATEGANAVIDVAFNDYGLTELVSFTAAQNLRSRRVMEKIGFQRNPSDDFLHPNFPTDDPLRASVLYRRFANSNTSRVATSTSSDALFPIDSA